VRFAEALRSPDEASVSEKDVRLGNLTGIWGAALIAIISEESLLISVSRTRKNFSASIGCNLAEWLLLILPKWIAANATKMRLLRLILHFTLNQQF
jgi:hypothetical protein